MKKRLLERVDIQNIPSFSSLKELAMYIENIKESDMLVPSSSSEDLVMSLGYQNNGSLMGYRVKVSGLGDEVSEEKRDERARIEDEIIKGDNEVGNATGYSIKDNEYVNQIVREIVRNTDTDRIFISTLPVIKSDFLNKRMPIISATLEKITLKKMKSSDTTFGVAYSDVLKKYLMVYNPDFLVTMAVKEFLYRYNMYKDFGSCFTYCFMFVLSHEIMHILRHHIQNKMNVLGDTDHEIVNLFGDAFINMNLSRKLYDNRLVNQPTAPAIGIMNENIFQAEFREDVIGKSFGDIKNVFLNILRKYTGVEFSARSNVNETLEVDNRKFILKLTYPEKSIIRIFKDNSSNFIKCMDEFFKYLSDEIKSVGNQKPEIQVGAPVRVKATGDRGVVVDENEDGTFKVAGSSGAEGDDLYILGQYQKNDTEDVNIIGDFEESELRPVVTQDVGGQEINLDGMGNGEEGSDDDYEVEQHGKANIEGEFPDNDNDKGKEGSTDKPLAVGSTVKIKGTGQVGVITNVNADGSFDVEEVSIFESKLVDLNLLEYYKKNGNKLGTFQDSELIPYDIDTPSGGNNQNTEGEDDQERESDAEGGGDSERESGDENEDPSDGDDQEGQEGADSSGNEEGQEGADSSGGEENQEEDSSGNEEGQVGQVGDSDSSKGGDESEESGDKGGNSGEDNGSTPSKSKIEQLLDDIAKTKDSTTVAKEEEEEKTRQQEDNMQNDSQRQASKKLKDDLQSALKNVGENLTDEEKDLLKGIGADRIAKIPNLAVEQWQRTLNRMLKNALGIKGTYNPRRPSRRVPDAFGSKEIKPDIKNIIIALDCSGSMGIDEFKESMRHIQTFLNTLNAKPKFTVVLWGSRKFDEIDKNAFTVKKKSDVYKLILARGKEKPWMTDLDPAIQYMQKKVWGKPDGIIFLTDGGIQDYPSIDSEKYIRKHKNKIVWVLTSNGKINGVRRFDKTAKIGTRVIKQRRNR